MSKGAIVLIPFPFTDLSGQKVRPALVLYSPKKRSEDCIVAFMSSAPRSKSTAYDIPVTPTKVNGLKVASVLKLEKMATLQKKLILGELGALDKATMSLVNKHLQLLFGL